MNHTGVKHAAQLDPRNTFRGWRLSSFPSASVCVILTSPSAPLRCTASLQPLAPSSCPGSPVTLLTRSANLTSTDPARGQASRHPPLSKGYMLARQRTRDCDCVNAGRYRAPPSPVKLDPQRADGCDYCMWTLDARDGDRGLYLMKGFMLTFRCGG